MSEKKFTRRNFIAQTASGMAAVAATGSVTNASSTSAASYKRIIGSNDRVNIGFLGCGSRSRDHLEMVKASEKDKNLAVVAVCDIWKYNREQHASICKTKFGVDVKKFNYSEDILKLPELDAVMIGTGDFQHAKLLAEVVAAGKDCYCEKPMATDLEDAKLARNTVLASKQVAQMGSQWVSDPNQLKVREIIRSGKLGQITKIEQVWNDPDVARMKQEDTDWNRWLLGKPYVPFDPWKYFEFRIFREYSGGISSQWMSHASGLIHFYTDTAIPDSMVANGGIFGWPDIRQNPDTFQALATYDDAKFMHSYTSNYASKFGDYTAIRGKDGTLFAHGGEGSARWFFIPEHQNLPGGFDYYEGLKEMINNGKAEIVSTPEYGMKPGPIEVGDNSKYHLDNWIDCIRDRNLKPNGHIHTGFWHAVAVIMATRAYREGKKLYWDPVNELIVDNKPD
jgi:predicted dehydrogenase